MRFAFAFCACAFAASAAAYNMNREWGGYYQQRPDNFAVEVAPNYLQQPSQNLFWDKLGLGNSFQGSNQVGGGLWGNIQNKFPFLTGLFSSRMEYPTLYGTPSQAPAPVYGPPQFFTYYQVPSRFIPPGGGVQVTDDAVVVSAPGIPPFAPPAPIQPPLPAPGPAPVATGYDYPRPHYRLELPSRNNLK